MSSFIQIGSMMDCEGRSVAQMKAFELAVDDLKSRCAIKCRGVSNASYAVVLQFQYACDRLPNPRRGIALSRFSAKNSIVGAYIEVPYESISGTEHAENLATLTDLYNASLLVISRHMAKQSAESGELIKSMVLQ